MVSQENIDLLIKLAENPKSTTPFDFQILSELLDQYPDFDLLRMVFIQAGERLGAKGAAFEKEKKYWKLKEALLRSPTSKKKETPLEVDENLSFTEKIERFIKNFKECHSPNHLIFRQGTNSY
ncbi:hypothetical protein [Jiulongibacter sediminis]|uniref:hypothetical protein n=1 Tax=Jiulongibacter sediminis TaxID=1605367 RepID=UPI0026ED136A|nr:hypothetical protein [Jiulongibacter sediminis]